MKETATDNASEIPASPRSGFLSVLCVLSYIGSSFWALLSVFGMMYSDQIIEFFVRLTSGEFVEGTGFSAEQGEMAVLFATGAVIAEIGDYFIIGSIISLVLSVLSLIGVAFIWKLKKPGFWMYSISNSLAMILMIWFGNKYIFTESLIASAITLAFIIMYSINLKQMK